jgi:Tfp pilus assembly protein PilF
MIFRSHTCLLTCDIPGGNRRRKDRREALLHQIRHDRAVLYFETSQRARARREFERLYAADPGFEDVAERLGVGG